MSVTHVYKAWGYLADFNNFQCNEPVIVDLPQSSGCSLMEMVNVKVCEICKEKCEYNSWLLYMLQNYTFLGASCHFLSLADLYQVGWMLW